MKKAGVFLSFLIIVIFFLGLNFLIWDREAKERDLKGLQEASSGSALTISALNRQIESLENSIKSRSEELDGLVRENEELKTALDDMRTLSGNVFNILEDKNNVINELYLSLDGLEYFSSIIGTWAGYINESDYERAFEMWHKEGSPGYEDLEEFTNRFINTIDRIDVVSVSLYEMEPKDLLDMEKAGETLKEMGGGDLFLLVSIEAQIEDWADKYEVYFERGLNKRIFVLKFDDGWYISDIRKL